jgi:hypothetical protein
MWHERVDFFPCCILIFAKAICHRVHRCHHRGFGKGYVSCFPLVSPLLTSFGRGNDCSAHSELLLDCGDHNHHFSRWMVHLSRTQACQARRDI